MIEISGAVGTGLYLLNHAYISLFNNWNRRLYFSVNLIAACLLVLSSAMLASWQAVAVNLFWASVSLLLLANVDLKRILFPRVIFHSLMLGWAFIIVIKWLSTAAFPSDWLAWSSTTAFCLAYLLFVSDKMRAKNYFGWNSYAALSLLPQLWLDSNWSVFVLEICWAAISLFGYIRHYRQVHLID